jgi:hypothetical protein
VWENLSGPWWNDFPLIPPEERRLTIQRATGLAEVNRAIAGDDWSGTLQDLTSRQSGLVSDLPLAANANTEIWARVTIEGRRGTADPWYFPHEFKVRLGMTAQGIAEFLAAEIDSLKAKYGTEQISAASELTLTYGVT